MPTDRVTLTNFTEDAFKKDPKSRKKKPKPSLVVHRLRIKYAAIKHRCYVKTSKHYKSCGGKGIQLYKPWLEDRQKFVDWAIKAGYILGQALVRKDATKDFTPDNCYFK